MSREKERDKGRNGKEREDERGIFIYVEWERERGRMGRPMDLQKKGEGGREGERERESWQTVSQWNIKIKWDVCKNKELFCAKNLIADLLIDHLLAFKNQM